MTVPDYQGGGIVNLMASIIAGRGGETLGYAPLTALASQSIESARNVVLLVVDGLGEPPGIVEVGRGGFAPQQVRVRGVGEAPGDRVVETGPQRQESLRRTRAVGDEWPVDRVDVRCEQPGALRIRSGDEHRRHVQHVRGEPRGDERTDELARGHQHLAALMAAFF